MAIRFLVVLGQQNNSSVRQQHCKDICAFWPESKNQSQQQRLLAVCVECWARLFYSGLVVEPIFYCEPYRTLLRAGSPGRLICWFLARTQILVYRRVYLNVSIVVGGTWTITIIISLWCGWLFCVGSCSLIVYYYHPFTVNFRIGMWKWKGVLSAQKAPPSFTWRRLLMGSS